MIRKTIVKVFAYLLVFAMFLVGLLIFTYPLLSGYVSDQNTATYIQTFENKKKSYTESKDSQDTEKPNELYSDLYAEMENYNRSIYENGQEGLCDAWAYEQSSIVLSEYGIDDEAVGVLRVPKMSNLEMPIFLGSSRNNMSRGAAQLGETSVPIGGNNTNCVLAGHRGWNGARYFLDIERMEIGDMVYIENFWDTLTYQVTEIKIINPNDIDAILIQENKDMVTLITCHPYWASTYRYAVFCTRVSDDSTSAGQTENTNTIENTDSFIESDEAIANDNTSQARILAERYSYFVISLLLVILAIVLLVRKRK